MTDWQFVPAGKKAAETCFKMDATVLHESEELHELLVQCEHFVVNQAPKGVNCEKICKQHALTRRQLVDWVEGWKTPPLINEVFWTSGGQISKVSISVPHWTHPETTTCFVSFAHNGSWCVCRCSQAFPEMRKCNTSITAHGIYLRVWQPSQRVLGEKCASNGQFFQSQNAWKLHVIES